MKIAPLLLASASALETASTAHNLLAAVGHRNATKMEALVQGLVEESMSEPAWKFDQDIRDALEAIRDIFVINIQQTLRDQHKIDQEDMNCFTESCFGGCVAAYQTTLTECDTFKPRCHTFHDKHVECRTEVKAKYITMAKSCSALHSFIQNWEDEDCPTEKCLCPDVFHCSDAQLVGYEYKCEPQAGDCSSRTYETWLSKMIVKFQTGWNQWNQKWNQCKKDYHDFLLADMECDGEQKSFETCMCDYNRCQDIACDFEYERCHAQCLSKYEDHVFDKECLEKDRKIDWSATKKIECYVDILLKNYTKEDLLKECGSTDCINQAREKDYKQCHTICLEVDYDGAWPTIEVTDEVKVDGHSKRSYQSDYLLGDGEFACDSNGPKVFTKHRGGGKSREAEARCTEHLDIDYQVPACVECRPDPPPVCDEAFHKRWYFDEFDDISMIEEITLHEDCPSTCFPDVSIESSSNGVDFETLTVKEHSIAWAFNRCECKTCIKGYPVYTDTLDNHTDIKNGHTWMKDVHYSHVEHGHLVCGYGAHNLVRRSAASADGSYDA